MKPPAKDSSLIKSTPREPQLPLVAARNIAQAPPTATGAETRFAAADENGAKNHGDSTAGGAAGNFPVWGKVADRGSL